MKILSFMNPVEFGGGERLMLDLGDYFESAGIAFSVVNLNRSPQFEEKLAAHHVRSIGIGNVHFKQTPTKAEYALLLLRLLWRVPRIASTIAAEDPEYVIANGFPTFVLVAAAMVFTQKRRRKIYIHHFMKARENRLVGYLYRSVVNQYDRIVAVSSLTRETLLAQFPELKEKILFVPNGINCKRFDVGEEKMAVRKRLHLPEGVIAMNTARLTAFKNHKMLVDVAKKIGRSDFHIVIAGSGDEYVTLSHMIADAALENNVLLLGSVDSEELPYYLKAADMFLFPSLKEGFGIAIIEAMAAGLPVVILRDIYIQEFGHDIMVAKDEAEFFDMATKLLEHPELGRDLGERARQYVVDNLDMSVTGKRFLEAIK